MVRLILPLAILFFATAAFALAIPLFTANTNSCLQTNSTYISCPNGKTIKIALGISTPETPYYGSFTAVPMNQSTGYYILDSYGQKCVIPASSTSTCFIYLKPISIFDGNGTLSKDIGIKLISSTYPQVHFNNFFQVRINHYETNETLQLASAYSAASQNITEMETTYAYACSTYNICNVSLNANITTAVNFLSDASRQMNASLLPAALVNTSYAKQVADATYMPFLAFKGKANNIINTILSANRILANVTYSLNQRETSLSNCSFSNGTSYSTYVRGLLADASNFPAFNTLQYAEEYLATAANVQNQFNQANTNCQSTIMPAVAISGNWLLYAFAGIFVIFALYIAYRYKEEHDMIARIREGANNKQSDGDVARLAAPQSDAATKPSGTSERQPSSLEESFNSWLSKATGKHADSAIESEEASEPIKIDENSHISEPAESQVQKEALVPEVSQKQEPEEKPAIEEKEPPKEKTKKPTRKRQPKKTKKSKKAQGPAAEKEESDSD